MTQCTKFWEIFFPNSSGKCLFSFIAKCNASSVFQQLIYQGHHRTRKTNTSNILQQQMANGPWKKTLLHTRIYFHMQKCRCMAGLHLVEALTHSAPRRCSSRHVHIYVNDVTIYYTLCDVKNWKHNMFNNYMHWTRMYQ